LRPLQGPLLYELFEIITPTTDEYDIDVIPPDGTFPDTFISANKLLFQSNRHLMLSVVNLNQTLWNPWSFLPMLGLRAEPSTFRNTLF